MEGDLRGRRVRRWRRVLSDGTGGQPLLGARDGEALPGDLSQAAREVARIGSHSRAAERIARRRVMHPGWSSVPVLRRLVAGLSFGLGQVETRAPRARP